MPWGLLHGDCASTLDELLVRWEEITIHCSNVKMLIVEMYECINFISPSTLSDVCATKDIKHDLRINIESTQGAIKHLHIDKVSYHAEAVHFGKLCHTA